jgi:hypothetical protein
LKITRGGTEKFYLLAASAREDGDAEKFADLPAQRSSFHALIPKPL